MSSNAKSTSRRAGTPAIHSELSFALYSTSLAMDNLYRQLLRPLQITYPQYLVMMILWEKDALSVSTIADRLFLDYATVSPILKRLEKAGLIMRERARNDERLVIVTLTERGSALQSRSIELPPSVAAASGTSGAQLEGLRDRLAELRITLQQNLGKYPN